MVVYSTGFAVTALRKGYDPVKFLLVVCLAASFAFMLPMAGGPNMVVYSTGKIPVHVMAKTGFALNIAAILLGSLYMCFVMPAPLGDYSHLPVPGATAGGARGEGPPPVF